MGLLNLFGGDKKTTTNTTSNLYTSNVTDSYNQQLTNNLTRSDSFIKADSTVQNTALDFINTYNLADTGNIYAGESGGFAGLSSSLDLNRFFEATRPAGPASANIGGWSKGNTLSDKFGGLTDLQNAVGASQAGNIGAANRPNNALYWIIGAAILSLVALVYFKKRKK